jgi:hypothetical protein
VFALRAPELGVAAVFSFPPAIGAITLGTLDFRRAEPGPLAETGIGAEEALRRLRTRAFTTGVALAALAREVVARRLRLDEDE